MHILPISASTRVRPLSNASSEPPSTLTAPKTSKTHQSQEPDQSQSRHDADAKHGTIRFIGTATTVIEYAGARLITDPNFLHAGDHVHLGPGVTGTRHTNPALELEQLPALDAVLLSHYHGDHFDQEVEARLNRALPIITTPHAKSQLSNDSGGTFTNVTALDTWDNALLPMEEPLSKSIPEGRKPTLKVTGMPGEHVPPGALKTLNDIAKAIPPVNGWMLELGSVSASSGEPQESDFRCGYRIYITGDTLLVDELHEIPKRYAGRQIDLMLIHLGGTTVPGPKMPLLMVTMNAQQGVELVKLVKPDVTVPIHYDDYDVFMDPLENFKKAMVEQGMGQNAVYLDRGEEYKFAVE